MKTETTILELVGEWKKAEESADSNRLNGMLTDDFVGIGPKGFILNKEQWKQRFTGGFKYDSLDLKDEQVREYENVIIVIAIQSQKGSYKGQRSDGDFRITQTWIRQGEEWLLACMQFSTIDANIPGQRS